MSFENFYFRKSLYMIGQNMGKADVSNLKFLCDYDLPKRHLEKIETAFELFCALENADKISTTNGSKLEDLLRSIQKTHLLKRHPLNCPSDPLIQTDRGGKLPETAELKDLSKFLVGISDDMSNRDLRNLICFVYDLVRNICTLMDMEKVSSANELFRALIADRLIGPKNLNMLIEIFEVIGRNDLCQKMKEYTSCGHPVMTHDQSLPSYHPNSLTMSSQSSSGSSYSNSSTPSSESTPDPSMASHPRVSLDHGYSGRAHPYPHVQSPQQPVNGSVGGHAYFPQQYHTQQPHPTHQQHPPMIYPGAQYAHPPIPPNVLPSVSQSLGNPGYHTAPYCTPPNVSQSLGSPYKAVPQPESFGQLGSAPTVPVQPTVAGAAVGERCQLDGTPVLVSQSEQNLLTELKEKERQLEEENLVKKQLLSTMEFQRELMIKLMQESHSPAPNVGPPPMMYPMNSVPHGLAVVIGNEIFKPNPERPNLELNNRKGCQLDVINFVNIFKILKYNVEHVKDLTASEFQLLFDRIANEDHSAYDSFVMCITSHGESNSYVFGSDSVSVDLYSLIRKIQGCKSLQNKPKMFFVQACRLPSEDLVSRDSGGKLDLSHNSEADVYIAWATSRDQAAYRSPIDGSWFVAALKEVFAANAQSQDLVTMMYNVTNFVSSAEGRERGSGELVQQCVETSSQLRGAVRFFH